MPSPRPGTHDAGAVRGSSRRPIDTGTPRYDDPRRSAGSSVDVGHSDRYRRSVPPSSPGRRSIGTDAPVRTSGTSTPPATARPTPRAPITSTPGIARRYSPPSDVRRPGLRTDAPGGLRDDGASARSGVLGSRGSTAIPSSAPARVADAVAGDRRPVPGASAPHDRAVQAPVGRRPISVPGMPDYGLGTHPGYVDEISTRVFQGKGRDSYLHQSYRHYRAHWGLSFCFGGNSFYTGYWNYCYRTAYAPYYHDCYSMRWGRGYYWWLPSRCYPLWRRYWSHWWCWSASYACRPWYLTSYWGTPVGFYTYCSTIDPDSSSYIYVGHLESTEPATSAERYKEATVDDLARHYLELGDLYFRTRRYLRAVTAYEKAVELVPDDGSLHLVLADALFADGQFARAAFELREAFRLHPALALAAVDKREFYGFPEDFEKHLATLREHLEAAPFDTNARLVLVVNLLFTGQLDEAGRELETLGRHLPGDALVPQLTEAVEAAALRAEEAAGK